MPWVGPVCTGGSTWLCHLWMGSLGTCLPGTGQRDHAVDHGPHSLPHSPMPALPEPHLSQSHFVSLLQLQIHLSSCLLFCTKADKDEHRQQAAPSQRLGKDRWPTYSRASGCLLPLPPPVPWDSLRCLIALCLLHQPRLNHTGNGRRDGSNLRLLTFPICPLGLGTVWACVRMPVFCSGSWWAWKSRSTLHQLASGAESCHPEHHKARLSG